MNSKRRQLTPQEKIAALKRHLLEAVPDSTICDELGVAPTLFYRWQKELFENGHTLFENGRKAKALEDGKNRRSSNSKPNSVMALDLVGRVLWPNEKAKLPGPPRRTLKLGNPGWWPRSASSGGSAIFMFCELIDAYVSVVATCAESGNACGGRMPAAMMACVCRCRLQGP